MQGAKDSGACVGVGIMAEESKVCADCGIQDSTCEYYVGHNAVLCHKHWVARYKATRQPKPCNCTRFGLRPGYNHECTCSEWAPKKGKGK